MSYSSFENDKLESADRLQINRKIYFAQENADISGLTALPLEQLCAMREESAAAEQTVFERLQQQSKEWEEQAGKTLLIDKAIEYVRIPEAQHTANQWEQPDEYRHVRSNMVYRMQYSISENTRYDREKEQSVPYSWTLSWSIYTNSPDGYNGAKIAGQSKKVFGTKEEMEKYLNGRIKAYQNLFTEISPPIPKEYAEHFKVNGQLLPGYTVEGEEQTIQQPKQETAKADEAPAEQAAKQATGQRTEQAPINEQFAILIDSRSRFETGEPGGEWLSLPTTTEQLHEAMKSVGITADNPQDFFINGYSYPDSKHLALPYDMVCAAGIDELNFLASRLNTLDPADLAALNAAAQRKKGFENIGQIIDFTYNTDFFVHIPEVKTVRDLGDYYLNQSGMVDMPEEWKNGIDFSDFGRNAAEQEHGFFTPYGYLVESGDEWERHFEGRSVPEEYHIMSFPEPDKLEKDEAAPEQEAAEPEPQPEAPPQPRPVNPIILTADKPAEKLKEITDRLEQGITELFDSERYKEYLQVMSKFHNYSFNNTLLIAMQKPDASLIAGFNAWKNNFGRNVMRGEKGIRILAPSPYKIRQEVEKKDPQTGKTVIGKDGKPVTETKEIQIPAYKVVAVFDVSQTEGRELPSLSANELTGDVEKYEDFFAALEKTSPVPMGFEKIEGTAHGYYHLEEKRIAIDEGMSQLQNLKTAIHEIAHAKLHDIDLNAPQEEQADRPDRRTREVQAESIAYTVCQHYGLDTSDYSFGYVAGWSSGRELAELKTSLETIRATAAEIINTIDGHFAELQKEREAAKEQEAEAQTPPDLTAEPTVTILYSESSQLHEGETFPLSRANMIIAGLDEANLASPGYDKTEFRIDYVMNGEADHYEGRQDLGDGDGSLVEHIEQYHTYYANDPNWNNFLLEHEGKEALEADREHRAFLLNEFVPYLKLHCNLSEMERTAGEALQKDNLTPTETAYHTAIQSYVSECRGLINQGEYHLPPVPQLADFDVELQAYKEHVKEEIAQEAADAGMTVEEYAANGYEPYATPEPEFIYKMEANPMTDGIHDRFFLQAYEKEDNGKAIPRDVLFIGTPEQCRELLGKLEAGDLSQEQVKELFAQAQEVAQEPEKTDTPIQEGAAADKAATPEQAGQTADKPLTDLQKKAVEIAAQYENLPMRDKIGIIAQAFGGTEGKIETSPCTGKWRGTSDISIKFDNGVSLFIGNHRTPQAKTVKVQSEYVNAALVRYNPEIIAATKETAITALRKREAKDNEIAAQKGLKPYTLLNVEFNDGTDERSSGHLGWYYVTLAVDGKICSHIETGLNYDILDGKVSDTPARENYFPAGALKETDVDYVFNNVGFSSTSALYSLPVRDDVLERAEKTLAQRKEVQPEKAADPEQTPQGAAQEAEPGNAATPETFYKVRQNPYSDSRENSHILQEYIAQDNGMAKLGDILYMGTPEKCWELLGKLEAGELTQGDVKELYAKSQEAQQTAEPGKEPDKDTFTIYQLKDGDGMRDYHFEPYDRLQAAGLSVEAANYNLIYTAELTPGTSLEDIFTRFNIDHPADFRGHSLSVSDIVVLHQNGHDTAHYVDSFGYKEVPEFLQEQTQQPEKENPLKHVEDAIEQNDNNFDGIINNTPTADELEAKARSGGQISLAEYAAALKAEKEQGKKPGKKAEKKPSIRAQLRADKERAAQRKQARNKSQDLERS